MLKSDIISNFCNEVYIHILLLICYYAIGLLLNMKTLQKLRQFIASETEHGG